MKVSILSAVHNEAAYIDEMIQSVVSQTNENWELIFVSDGSTDETVDVIRARMVDDTRISLAGDGRKIGKVQAFNRAYEASTGDIVVLLAGDDTLPQRSLEYRVGALADVDPMDEVVAFFKIRTMSMEPTHHDMVLPRGNAASHSGGTITLTRGLAARVFPIDERLVSEDLWLSRAAEGTASSVRDRHEVVLNYRIHDGNSNPRMRSFASMNVAMAARHEAWSLLLSAPQFRLNYSTRRMLERLYAAELLRRRGQVLALLGMRELPLADRAGFASQANRLLFWIRQRFYRHLTGRRGR